MRIRKVTDYKNLTGNAGTFSTLNNCLIFDTFQTFLIYFTRQDKSKTQETVRYIQIKFIKEKYYGEKTLIILYKLSAEKTCETNKMLHKYPYSTADGDIINCCEKTREL